MDVSFGGGIIDKAREQAKDHGREVQTMKVESPIKASGSRPWNG